MKRKSRRAGRKINNFFMWRYYQKDIYKIDQSGTVFSKNFGNNRDNRRRSVINLSTSLQLRRVLVSIHPGTPQWRSSN